MRTISVGVALLAFGLFVAGCEKKGAEGNRDTTKTDTSGINVDSTPKGADVSANENEYEFDGVVKSVSGDMVSVKHEAIGSYKDSGTTSFKLADKDMEQYVKAGERKHFTIKVSGDQALITQMEDTEDASDSTKADK